MGPEFSILTVCTGNIHRSALAATLLGTWAGWYLPDTVAGDVRVGSAGLAAPVGSPMGRRVRAVARALGADGEGHRATQIDDDAIENADLVLVATRRQRDAVLGRSPGALRKTFTIREAGRLAEGMPSTRPRSVADLREIVDVLADRRGRHVAASDDDIIDPQGRDDAAYHRMIDEELLPLVYLARALLGMSPGDFVAYLGVVGDPQELIRRGLEAEER